MASLGGPITQLTGAITTLNHGWAATSAVWNDSVQRDFEREHLAPLDVKVWATLREMERLAQVMDGARRHVR